MTGSRFRAALLAAALAAACGHGEPFGVPSQGTDQPFAPGSPTRLTLNTLSDSEPSWLPDGSALLYTATRLDSPDTAGCLELLPPTGGQATRSICPGLAAAADSTRALQGAAVSPGGRLVYLRSARRTPNLGWRTRELVLTSLEPGTTDRVLATLPIGGSIPGHNGLSQVRWLDDDRFVYRADIYYLVFPCNICPPIDADSSAGFLVLVDTRPEPATFTVVPGTGGATSVATTGPDSILFTVRGDSLLYLERLSTGTVAPFFNSGSGHVAGGVQYANGRLVALVDTELTRVDFSAGGPPVRQVISARPYFTPALSPDGKRLVASRQGDLWLFDLP